jgi:hypothetical protein
MTNFNAQVTVYSGSCDTLQCIAWNEYGTTEFFGGQGVTYHIRVHGQQKGEFGLSIKQANVALAYCEEMKHYMTFDPYIGSACECTANGQDAVLTCQDDCSYCNADKSVCATKATLSAITASLQPGVTAMSTSYTYTKGLEGLLELETTECNIDGIVCSACSVSFKGEQCNSCTPTQCDRGMGIPSFDIDCSNIDPNAVISLCDSPSPESGPLQVLSIDGIFGTCVRDPLDVCNRVKDFQIENYELICECSGNSSSATLTCSDPTCPMSCNRDYTVCWKDTFATVFDADGQQASIFYSKTYMEGRDEVVTWEGRGSYDTCSMTVNGVACNSCGTTSCSEQDYEAETVDCENIESGASFDTCRGFAEGRGVLQAFNENEVVPCLRILDPQALCQEELELHAGWGTTCECALDTITGQDYVLTCEGSCLSCNREATVCANQTSSFIIGKYGQRYSDARSYTYVLGERDEAVVLGGLDGGFDGYGKDCYVIVNGTPCNSCGPVTCNEELGQGYVGLGVDCENIETGLSYDTCSDNFVVDTGVLEVLSPYEFGMCHTSQTFEDNENDFNDA